MKLIRDWELERSIAVADAEANRETHIAWRDWLRAHPDDPRAEVAGDLTHQERAIREYDRIIDVLNYAQAPPGAKEAA